MRCAGSAQRRVRTLSAHVTAVATSSASDDALQRRLSSPPARPVTGITSSELDTLFRDGVVCLRNVLPPEWVSKISAAVDAQASKAPANMQVQKALGWLDDNELAEIIYGAPTAHLAQQALNALHPETAKGVEKEIRFLYDQIFVKWPSKASDVGASTPWHHDITFWPYRGEEMITIWIPLDRVNLDNGGLEFIPGSHKWTNRYKALGVSNEGYLPFASDNLEDLPKFRSATNGHKVSAEDPGDAVHFDVGPGDALIFTPTVMHGAPPNLSPDRKRRGIALRYMGGDVVFDDMKYGERTIMAPFNIFDDTRGNGDKVEGPMHPLLLPEKRPEEIERRAQGKISAVPELMMRWMQRKQQVEEEIGKPVATPN